MREEHLVGIRYLEAVTILAQRMRAAHPTLGQYEAADFQWWWSRPRPTDSSPQLFWFDDADRPEAAVIATDWGDSVGLDVVTMPEATPDFVAHVVDRGFAHAKVLGFDEVGVVIDRADEVMTSVLAGHRYTVLEDELVESWLVDSNRPRISPLHSDYRLTSRSDTLDRPHPMIRRAGPEIETRLGQASLYRPDLDLVVFDKHDEPAAYGMFWLDPETATGLVEPMRTEDDHQRRGLARHLLTAGVDRLAEAGAERIKICFSPGNPAAKGLYLSVGFEPVKQCATVSRPG